ncbi:MAG TPA: DUF4340 domain-containing protein [Candidatus Nitrosotenuis sp.]|jgi:hypothetical protein|nr:DUF4340 domain-containing protein [Candidatus Nitrosotenuis sp.]
MNRGTLILLIVVIAAGAFWWWHDVRGKEQRQKTQETQERFFPQVEGKDIGEIRVRQTRNSGVPELVLVRRGGRWLIQGSQTWLAAQQEVDGLADQLATLRQESVIQAEPAPRMLAEYGLDKPMFEVQIQVRGQHAGTYTLRLGDRTPDESGLYAIKGQEGPVVKVMASVATTLEKKPEDLRAKDALAVEPGQVQRVKATLPSGSFELALTEEKWRLTAPMAAPADRTKVMDFLWDWRNLKAGRFLGPEEKVDFSRPLVRIEAWQKDVEGPVILELGPQVPARAGVYYARRLDPEEVFVVEMPKGKDLLKVAAADFEDKHVLSFEVDQVDLVAGQVQGQDLEARRIRDGWDVRKPGETTDDAIARNAAVNDLLFDVQGLQWKEPAPQGAAAHLDRPRARLTLKKEKDQAIGTLLVGAPVPGGKGAYVQREGETKIYIVEKDPVPEWQKMLGRLKPKGSPTPGASPASPAGASPGPAAPESPAGPEIFPSPIVPQGSPGS